MLQVLIDNRFIERSLPREIRLENELLKVSHDGYILVKAKYLLALAQIFFFFFKNLNFLLSSFFYHISPVYSYTRLRFNNFCIHLIP